MSSISAQYSVLYTGMWVTSTIEVEMDSMAAGAKQRQFSFLGKKSRIGRRTSLSLCLLHLD